jgi:hypothetical protein
MNSNNSDKAPFQQSQEGSGSAENKGQGRNEQQARNTNMSQQDKQDVAGQLGEDKNRVADLDDLGMRSGRDDASGGSGDRMENESTGEATDR